MSRRGDDTAAYRERYERITANVSAVVWELDVSPDGSSAFTFISDNVERIFGARAEAVLGDARVLFRRIVPDDRAAFFDRIDISRAQMAPFRFEGRWETRADEVRWFVNEGLPVEKADGTVRWYGLLRDVTGRKRAELALQQSEERLRLALASADMGVWDWDLATGQVVQSPEAARIWRTATTETDIDTLMQVVHPEDRSEITRRVRQALEAGVPLELEVRVVHEDEALRWINCRGDVHGDRAGRATNMRGIVQDITRRKLAELAIDDARRRADDARKRLAAEMTERARAEAALRVSEERYSLAARGANDGLWEWGIQEDRFYLSGRAMELLGYGDNEAQGSVEDFAALIHDDDLETLLEQTESTSQPEPFTFDARIRCRDRGYRWFNVRGQVSLGPDGEPIRMAGSLRDITEQRRAESLRRRFIEKVLLATDEERRRIARELHDGTGQALTSLLVRLRTLQSELPTPALHDEVTALRELTTQTLDEVGRLARGLHPSVLDDLGFVAAVERYVAEYAAARHISVDVHLRELEGVQRLPASVEATLYRIIQEALANIAKHAGPCAASIVVERMGSVVRAIVEDDGHGFAPDAAGGGLGLVSIRERAALLGGEVEIESGPQGGTTLFVTIPLS